MTNLALADLQKFWLGFDRFVDSTQIPKGEYPRFNIVRVGGDGFRVELAIPGWDKNDVEIILHQVILTVNGKKKQLENENESYMYKGLSGKCFTRQFGVSEHVKLEKAYMERGLLCIDLHEEIPLELQPVKVTIS